MNSRPLSVAAAALCGVLLVSVTPPGLLGQPAAAEADAELTRIDAEIPIPASAARVWAALTTPEGLERWIAPESRVELVPGGAYELYFFPDSADRGMEGTRVLSFIPEEMLSYTGELADTWVVWRIEPRSDGSVVLRFTGLGYGESWAERSKYFARVMPGVLERLKAAAEGG